LLLERSAAIDAQIDGKNVTVRGTVRGNMQASEKVEICSEARVQGDIKAPRLVMQEGARFRGLVEMDVKLPPGLLDPN
jgi:cytoskeletal protein CcmA (bactofilin family)